MPLSAGTKLGPYEILSTIGAGGMGEVYKARDTRLDRIVALKTSRTEFSERFEREARAIAALNHSNICQLYDVGPNYLVMEYIEGTPLRGPLPLDQVLKYGTQICDALDAAHKKGITHRDLKPANVLVTKTGVKLLDFGLAKIAQSAKPIDDVTVTMALTGKNEIVSTLYYMSPEQLQGQANGQEIDSRSDIFSFGLVLYELLTGKRAMEGGSPASVIAAIMERPAPSITDVAPAVLDRVLKRCLEKDPDNRWQSAADVKAAFELVTPPAVERSVAPTPKPKTWLWGALAVLSLGAATFMGAHLGGPSPTAPRQAVRFQIPVSPATGLRPLAAISPDGLSLAYFDAFADGKIALKIRPMDSGEAADFPATEMSQPTYIFWSPDSKSVYFGSRRFLKRLDIARSTVQAICDCSSDSGTINRDGVILLGSTPARREIIRVSSTAESLTLRKGRTPTSLPNNPNFLPDGRRYIYAEDGGLFLSSLDGPQAPPQRLADVGGPFVLLQGSTGHYLASTQSNGDLDALPFDAQSGTITGPALTLAAGTSVGSLAQSLSSASSTGILLREIQVESHQIAVWLDRQGKRLSDLGPVEGYASVSLSPDGSRLATIDSASAKVGGFGIRDLTRGTATKIAQQVRPAGTAVWSADGGSVIFTAQDKNRVQHLYRADASNTQPESMLLDEPGLHWPNDWSRDGKYLLYGFDEGKTSRDLWVLRMDQPGAKPVQYTHGASLIKQGRFSPDGRFVAYTSDESGRYEVVVQPFPDASKGKWVVSQAGGVEPRWSRDGGELFFFSGQELMSVEVRTNGEAFNASVPRELFRAPVPVGYSNDSVRWQLLPDGSRILLLIPSSGEATAYLEVTTNWEGLLKH